MTSNASQAAMRSVLIANRGEVAVRIIRSAKAMGLRTIAVHTEAERHTRHVREADAAFVLRGTGVAAYLDITDMMQIVAASGADLVHPGYGFLSENGDFASALEKEDVGFVGPDAETLRLFGDKPAARALAASAGVPVLRASETLQDPGEAARFLAENPGPAIVKAVAGGGGRGVRIVSDPSTVEDLVIRASSEAARSFDNGDVYIEQYLPQARHIEVQIAGDGRLVTHFGTRDCSLQRRHQKMIEFAPAPAVPVAVERAMTDAAVAIARAVNYRGIGTVEFLVDPDHLDAFFFIEGNPRLQVEHGVTELITGVDLVSLQFAIALGRTLEDEALAGGVTIRGAAAEARVTADVGTISRFQAPPDVRVDTAAEAGLMTGTEFDPLLAKLLVTGDTFEDAVARLRDAVDALIVDGAPTNQAELLELLTDRRVRTAKATTTLADELAAKRGGAAPILTSPVSGTVIAVLAEVGSRAVSGRALFVIEAMKMEHEVEAPMNGILNDLHVSVGDRVKAGDALGTLTPGDPTAVTAQDDHPESIDEGERRDVRENLIRHERILDAARPEAVARRHAKGKRTARENVSHLLDGDLIEHGGLVIAAQRRRRSVEELERMTPADGVVTGFGPVTGVGQVAVLAYDYTVLAGTQGIQSHKKAERLFDLARRRGAPVVVYAEGGGGRPGDVDNEAKATGMDLGTFVAFGRLSKAVPTVAIASGRCFAGNAALVGASDLVIATEDANIGMGGPAMIEGAGLGSVTPEEIGPASLQYANGVADILVADEAEATEVARRYLAYFSEARSSWSSNDQAELRHIVPESRARVFDIRRLITLLTDRDSVLELRGGFGKGIVTSLARIDGAPVGVIANDGSHLGGAIDSDSADKMVRFLGLCDTFGIPIVSLCDTPGFLVGPESEETAAVRRIGEIFRIGPNLSVPLCTVVVRKAWGLGGQAMAGGSFRVPDAIVAWPTAEFGAMGPEGAVRLGYKRELEAIEDPTERDIEFRRLVDEYIVSGRGYQAASVFEIDDVIDPAVTRDWIASALAAPALSRRHPDRTTRRSREMFVE